MFSLSLQLPVWNMTHYREWQNDSYQYRSHFCIDRSHFYIDRSHFYIDRSHLYSYQGYWCFPFRCNFLCETWIIIASDKMTPINIEVISVLIEVISIVIEVISILIGVICTAIRATDVFPFVATSCVKHDSLSRVTKWLLKGNSILRATVF